MRLRDFIIVMGVIACLLGAAFYFLWPTKKIIINPEVTVQDLTTPKGHKLWLAERHYSKAVALSLLFRKAGAQSDPQGKVARANLAIDLLLEGAGPYKTVEFKRKILENKITIQAGVDEDSVKIALLFPSANLKSALSLLRLLLTEPHYEQESLERRRNQILINLEQSFQEAETKAAIALYKLVFASHPYGRTIEDSLRDLPHITLEDIRTYRQQRLTKDQLEIVAVGDLVPEDFLVLLDDVLELLPAKSAPLDVGPATLHHLGATKTVTIDVPQAVILFLQPGLTKNDPDLIPSVLIRSILGSGTESRLWQEIREKQGLVYHINLQPRLNDHAQILLGVAGTKNANVQEVVGIIRQQWRKLYENGVTKQELESAKERITGSFVLGLASTSSLCAALASFKELGLDPNYINERNYLFSRVTLKEINRVVKRIMQPQDLTVVVAGRPAASGQSEKIAPDKMPDFEKVS